MPLDAKYHKLKQEITRLDMAILGTLRRVYLRCGKASCRCASRRKLEKHGPYFFWDRKANGQLASLTLGKEDLPQFQRWIKNRQKLERIVGKMLQRGSQIASQLRKSKRHRLNQKN